MSYLKNNYFKKSWLSIFCLASLRIVLVSSRRPRGLIMVDMSTMLLLFALRVVV